MILIRCRRCKRKFDANGRLGQLCPYCTAHDEEEFKKVRAYIQDNSGITINEVSEIMNIPRGKLINYLREERLEIKDVKSNLLNCRKCGKSIKSGIFCETCKRAEFINVSSTYKPPSRSTEMHTRRKK